MRFTKISRNLAGIGAVLLVWQALTSAGVINPFLLPPPSLLLATFWEMTLDGSLFTHAGASLDRVVVGFMVAAFVGITLGVALGWWSMASDLLKPIVEALRPIPPIAWTPLAILWFGIGNAPSYFLVFIGAVFPVFVNTFTAVKSLDRAQVNAALCLGAKPRLLMTDVVISRRSAHHLSGSSHRVGGRMDVRRRRRTDRLAIGIGLHDSTEPASAADAECADRHGSDRPDRIWDERRHGLARGQAHPLEALRSSPVMQETSAQISIRGVSKTFSGRGAQEGVKALADVSLDIYPGEFVVLLGPSGCGKSTLLNLVAGFARPSSGSILHDGAEVAGPDRRRTVVFQEYALFPWKTVQENVEFGLKAQGVSREERRATARHLLSVVHLSGFEDRYPHEISGGMKQRAAIARAIAPNPELLLMDEPFGALDAQTRVLLQEEVARISAETGKTIVFVTHSIDEAVFLEIASSS